MSSVLAQPKTTALMLSRSTWISVMALEFPFESVGCGLSAASGRRRWGRRRSGGGCAALAGVLGTGLQQRNSRNGDDLPLPFDGSQRQRIGQLSQCVRSEERRVGKGGRYGGGGETLVEERGE